MTSLLLVMAMAADPAPVVPDPPPIENRVYALERRVELLERLAGTKPLTTPVAAPPAVLAESAPTLPASAAPTYPPPAHGGPWAWDGRSAWVGAAVPMSLGTGTTTPTTVRYQSGPTNPDGTWVTPRQYQMSPFAAPAFGRVFGGNTRCGPGGCR